MRAFFGWLSPSSNEEIASKEEIAAKKEIASKEKIGELIERVKSFNAHEDERCDH